MTLKYLTLQIEQNAACHLGPCRLAVLLPIASKTLSGFSEIRVAGIAASSSGLEEEEEDEDKRPETKTMAEAPSIPAHRASQPRAGALEVGSGQSVPLASLSHRSLGPMNL